MNDTTQESDAGASQESGDSILKVLLPYLIGTALVSAILVLAVVRFSGFGAGRGAPVQAVVFDAVKLANAQRAIASSFVKQDGSGTDNAALLMEVSKHTRESILKVAGPNTLVLVKQGVVSPELRDITDDVLKDLGLPTKVPTVDTMGYLTDVAPTYLSILRPPARANPPAPASGSGSILP